MPTLTLACICGNKTSLEVTDLKSDPVLAYFDQHGGPGHSVLVCSEGINWMAGRPAAYDRLVFVTVGHQGDEVMLGARFEVDAATSPTWDTGWRIVLVAPDKSLRFMGPVKIKAWGTLAGSAAGPDHVSSDEEEPEEPDELGDNVWTVPVDAVNLLLGRNELLTKQVKWLESLWHVNSWPCPHIKWGAERWERFNGFGGEVPDGWLYCPVCGACRPIEKKP